MGKRLTLYSLINVEEMDFFKINYDYDDYDEDDDDDDDDDDYDDDDDDDEMDFRMIRNC